MAAGTRSWNTFPGWGRMAVTPVCTVSPSITVTCPMRTPATSVMALRCPGDNVPGAMPSSRARSFCCPCARNAPPPNNTVASTHRLAAPLKKLALRRRRCGKERLEPVEQLALGRIDLFTGNTGGEPSASVDFRKGEPAARSAGPLGFHRIAGDVFGIGIALPGPGMHHLSRLLPDGAQRKEGTEWMEPGFLLELPARRRQQVLAWLGDAFRYGPGPGVPRLPERPPRMGQEHLHLPGTTTVQQETGTGLGWRQIRTLSAQKNPAGSGSLRPLFRSTATSSPGSSFHQPQNPSSDTAVIVRWSTYASSVPACPSRKCEPASTAPGCSGSREPA